MREKVLALARGNFIYEAPDLVIRPEKLSFTVVSGKPYGEGAYRKCQRTEDEGIRGSGGAGD